VRRFSLAALGFLLVFAAPAFAQDATEVDSDHYKVEFENDQVRVLRITYGPGEKSVMHWHPDAIAVNLTDNTFQMHAPDGTSEEYSAKKGDVGWTEAVTHLPENLTNASAEVILIEFKTKSEEGCM
jgi:quercetin dioxygenase-like cupin family protein